MQANLERKRRWRCKHDLPVPGCHCFQARNQSDQESMERRTRTPAGSDYYTRIINVHNHRHIERTSKATRQTKKIQRLRPSAWIYRSLEMRAGETQVNRQTPSDAYAHG